MIIALAASFVQAVELPDIAFQSLESRDIIFDQTDGSEVAGRLIGFDEAIVVIEFNNEVLLIERSMISGLRTSNTTPLVLAPTESISIHERMMELDRLQRQNKKDGMLNLLVTLPLSLTTFGVGVWNLKQHLTTHNDANFFYGTFFVVSGAAGTGISIPVGIKQLKSAKNYRLESETLRSHQTLIIPAINSDGGSIHLIGRF